MKCPLCSSVSFGKRLVKDLRQCSGCGLRRREEIPSRAELRERTRNFVLSGQTNERSRRSRINDAHQQLVLLDMLPASLYDVGAAGGFFLKVARDAGWAIHGNEISMKAIAFAYKQYGIRLAYGLLEELQMLPKVYAVVLWNVLEHTIDPLVTMRIAASMLPVGGQCIISVPMKTERQLRRTFAGGHLSEFTPESLMLCCETAGFTELSSRLEQHPKARQGISKWRIDGL